MTMMENWGNQGQNRRTLFGHLVGPSFCNEPIHVGDMFLYYHTFEQLVTVCSEVNMNHYFGSSILLDVYEHGKGLPCVRTAQL